MEFYLANDGIVFSVIYRANLDLKREAQPDMSSPLMWELVGICTLIVCKYT